MIASGTDITANDYDITLKATKTAGAEGFLIAFGIKDSGTWYWWNLGGWNNTQGAVEKATGSADAKEQIIDQAGHGGHRSDLQPHHPGAGHQGHPAPGRRGVGRASTTTRCPSRSRRSSPATTGPAS